MLVARQLAPSACKAEAALVETLSGLSDEMAARIAELKAELSNAECIAGAKEKSLFFRGSIVPVMDALRAAADEIEALTAKEYWPYPTYSDMLFYV